MFLFIRTLKQEVPRCGVQCPWEVRSSYVPKFGDKVKKQNCEESYELQGVIKTKASYSRGINPTVNRLGVREEERPNRAVASLGPSNLTAVWNTHVLIMWYGNTHWSVVVVNTMSHTGAWQNRVCSVEELVPSTVSGMCLPKHVKN